MDQSQADYTYSIASLEIILLLLGAFLLGMLLCWLLRKMGLCCRGGATADEHDPHTYPAEMQSGGRKQHEFPARELTAGGYTADINSLLRDNDAGSGRGAGTTIRPTMTEGASAAAAATAAAASSKVVNIGEGHKDDLKKLEGIGPRLEKILNASGIQNFQQLAAMTPDEIKPILESAGNQFKMHDPKSWPYQAELASKGEWERLKEYQNLLLSGND